MVGRSVGHSCEPTNEQTTRGATAFSFSSLSVGRSRLLLSFYVSLSLFLARSLSAQIEDEASPKPIKSNQGIV